MKSLRNRILVIAALALVTVFASATPAGAQAAFHGSFTLTHEVHWQKAILPAGDYTFDMRSLSTPSLVSLTGPNGSVFITAMVADDKPVEQSTLIIENRGGRSDVSELRLAAVNRTLRYAVRKAPKDIEVAQAPVTREQILVAINSK